MRLEDSYKFLNKTTEGANYSRGSVVFILEFIEIEIEAEK